MAKIVDFERARQPRTQQRHDANTAALRERLQNAREEAAGLTPTRKLLDLYRPKKKPKKP
ncbi:MAG: hypothetical protein SV422_13815 [Pseudomonadota bacterium]|nr:hypothetical protein [Pseudomonadota bacterium]